MLSPRIDQRHRAAPSFVDQIERLHLSVAPAPLLPAVFARHSDTVAVVRRGVLHRAGDPVTHVWLITAGWFGRMRSGQEGEGAFTALYVPGDVIGLDAMMGDRLPDEVRALSDACVMRLPLEILRGTVAADGAAALEVVRLLASDARFLREALFSIGTQSALARLSTFLLQTFQRLQAAGLCATDADRFPLPLTQVQLGAATGLTSIHINRTLKHLREARLLSFHSGCVHVLDLPGLQQAARRSG